MSVSNWREISRKSFTQLGPLLDFLQFSAADRKSFDPNPQFPLLLPLRLAKKIRHRDPQDPILLQFAPLREETVKKEGYCPDPVQDRSFRKESKLLQKYHARSLLLATSVCAMHCRFCFRKHFPYERGGGFENEFRLIEKDTSTEEVLLSGGDPLSLSNENLKVFLQRLEEIPHVKRIRFHTRFPIGIPERIDEGFLALLGSNKKQIIFTLHVNHPIELDEDVLASLKQVSRLGIPILTQTVLLKGINDNLDTLKELFNLLVNHGIIPYYLHALDRVEGTHHFDVEEERALHLMQELQKHLPGYAVPHFVREIAGEPSKTRIL